jgi:hypothetical protein
MNHVNHSITSRFDPNFTEIITLAQTVWSLISCWTVTTLGGPGEIYRACMAGRQRRERFPRTSINCASKVLHLIHSDLVGPMPITSLRRSRYFVFFTYNYTHKFWMYFMAAKNETFQIFQNFKSQVEKET